MFDWLWRFLGRSAEEDQRLPEPRNYSVAEPERLYSGNGDVLRAMRFSATLSWETPLSVLQHHAEVFTGLPDQLPQYGDLSEGVWLPEVDYSGLGLDAPDEGTMATAIGPVAADGGHFLPFLKKFRAVVESGGSEEEQFSRLRTLARSDPEYRKIARRLDPKFPSGWFAARLQEIPGFGQITARKFVEAGVLSLDHIRRTSDEKLLKVDGVGIKAVERIRAYVRE